jgi:alpha-glucosidase
LRTGFYQAYPDAFDPRGLQGLSARRNYFRWLGVDGLISSPVNRFREKSHDRLYSPLDHTHVDSTFGGVTELRSINAALAAAGISPVGDFVLNHVDSHSDIARRAIADPAHWGDWLRTSKDPVRDRWDTRLVNFFGLPSWTYRAELGASIATPFYSDQYALDHEHPAVRDYLCHVAGDVMLDYWGYHGLRLDAMVSAVVSADLRHMPPIDRYGQTAPDPVALGTINALRRRVLNPRERLVRPSPWTIAEGGGSLRYMRGLMTSSDVDYAYDVSWWAALLQCLMHGEWSTLDHHLEELRCGWGRLLFYLDSHDERIVRYIPYADELIDTYGGPHREYVCCGGHGLTRRVRAMLPSDAAYALTVALTTFAPGTPVYYQGDLEALPGDSSAYVFDQRDPNRCRMPWDARLPEAGWGDTHSPYSLDPAWPTRSVAQQMADPGSPLNRNRRAVHVRRASGSLQGGEYERLTTTDRAALAFARDLNGYDPVIIIANATDAPLRTSVDLARYRRTHRLVSLETRLDQWWHRSPVRWPSRWTWAERADHEVDLEPYEVRVIRAVRPDHSRSLVDMGNKPFQGRTEPSQASEHH